MSRNQAGLVDMPCCADVADGSRIMQACPCTGWLRRHRFAAYTALIVVGLGLLALQVGWILGVVAFFRTL